MDKSSKAAKWLQHGRNLRRMDLEDQRLARLSMAEEERKKEEEQNKIKKEYQNVLISLQPYVKKISDLVDQASSIGVKFVGPLEQVKGIDTKYYKSIHELLLKSEQFWSREKDDGSGGEPTIMYSATFLIWEIPSTTNEYIGITKTKTGVLIQIFSNYISSHGNIFDAYNSEFESKFGELVANIVSKEGL